MWQKRIDMEVKSIKSVYNKSQEIIRKRFPTAGLGQGGKVRTNWKHNIADM